MDLVALVTLLIFIEYFVFVSMVGVARGKAGIDAPAMSGDPLFERTLRVQQNTLEQLVYVLPSMWLFAMYTSELWAAIAGVAFLIGRAMYFIGYRKAPGQRAAGFLVGMLAGMVMLLGALYGVVIKLLA